MLSFPISSSGYKFRKSSALRSSHANRRLRSYGATTLQIHDLSGRPGQAPTLAYNRELYRNDGPPRGMIMQTNPSREFVAAHTGELRPSLQRHLGPARCRPGESGLVIPSARAGCGHRLLATQTSQGGSHVATTMSCPGTRQAVALL